MRRALCLAAVLLAAAAPVAAQKGPAAALLHLPPEVLALACAPTITYAEPVVPLRVTGGQDSFTRQTYSPGDLITINAGTFNGIEVGQTYYIRRVETRDHKSITDHSPGTVITAGWLRVWAVDDEMSLATIEHACGAIDVGDYLEPFKLPDVPTPSPAKPKAEKGHYARVMSGTDLRQTFGKGDFFIINRGSKEGVFPGAQFVVYHDKREAENFLYELGEAVAVDVRPDSSTLQVTLSRDAFSEGDYVAQRK